MKIKGNKMLRVLLVVSLFICFNASAALASDSVDIYLHDVSDNTDTWLDNYTTSELNALDTTVATYHYSTVNCTNNKFYRYDAVGPDLEDVLTNALSGSGTILDDITSIRFYGSSDGYDTGYLSKSSVLSGLYFTSSTDTIGDPVKAIIATQYGNFGGTLYSTNCLRDFFGQQLVDEDVMQYWVKNTDRIYISKP